MNVPTFEIIRPAGGWSLLARRLLHGALCAFALASAPAQAQLQKPLRLNPTLNLSDTWQINGNGWTGQLVINQSAWGGRIQGKMYGNDIVGYFSPGEGTAVIVRYSPANTPMQAFIGTVSPDGTRWSGKFYGLDIGFSGASEARNVWAFNATRGTASVPAAPTPLSFGPSAATPLSRAYGISANGYGGAMTFTSGSSSAPNFGQLDGFLYGNPVAGTFSTGTNTLALLRYGPDGRPAQVYIGSSDRVYIDTCHLVGNFYPLTEPMGADPARLTYNWQALRDPIVHCQ
jgi:hypothetical protein